MYTKIAFSFRHFHRFRMLSCESMKDWNRWNRQNTGWIKSNFTQINYRDRQIGINLLGEFHSFALLAIDMNYEAVHLATKPAYKPRDHGLVRTAHSLTCSNAKLFCLLVKHSCVLRPELLSLKSVTRFSQNERGRFTYISIYVRFILRYFRVCLLQTLCRTPAHSRAMPRSVPYTPLFRSICRRQVLLTSLMFRITIIVVVISV